ncbi:hypothetical protein Poli38472_010817 [Pythium oligandrum]|uniref:sphingomyelin phosphodiesterase n=1 Tax=Pythium oligandrum TaxID=41045 RepID=A0A8K1FI64_PYTOL|nr:hypothetical protein Poli38472_010817 [Pythium oligandrum]|eukprot:TMW61754.1 hypothetical protein Poli38472_010817 [Pythium oligandrum]
MSADVVMAPPSAPAAPTRPRASTVSVTRRWSLQDIEHVDTEDAETSYADSRRAPHKHDEDDDEEEEDVFEPSSEFVCYGDRLCLLCEGQLLALTRKFNLSYEQMALLAMSTLCTGGLMGIASFFIWQKGWLRKRYAALFSNVLYEDDAMNAAKRSKEAEESSRAVMFRIFQYDPVTQSIAFQSLGQPVRFDEPIVIVHAASRRAMRYISHRGAITISRPPRYPLFQRHVKTGLAEMQRTMLRGNAEENEQERADQARARPHSVSGTILQALFSGRRERLPAPKPSTPPLPMPPSRASLYSTESATKMSSTNTSTSQLPRLTAGPTSQPVAREPSSVTLRKKSRHRSSSESCLQRPRREGSIPTTGALFAALKQRRAIKKRKQQLTKNLPNMWFPTKSGELFVATLRPVGRPCLKQLSLQDMEKQASENDDGDDPTSHATSSTASEGGEPLDDGTDEEFLRWGAPMQIVAAHNHRACGFRSREYYRDSQRYLSTDVSPTTMIPIPENGNLQAIAKESIRLLAHLERRQVELQIGTYNVWMLPRKLSMFTNVSPRKNTRARLIADVLPDCDIWVFTECFDHRARNILLDRLKTAGYCFSSPTVGHKQRDRDGRYIKKMLNGGVVLVSKYPILSIRIKLFQDVSAGSDKFADKGVLYCKILKDGLIVHVFSTHLQAWNDTASRRVRKTQLQMIASFMASLGIDDRNDAVVFTGDLNVNYWLNPENGEYDEMLDILNVHDPARVRTQSFDNVNKEATSPSSQPTTQYSFDPRVNPLAAGGLSSDGSLELLDYVMYSRSFRQPSKAESWVQPLMTKTPWTWRKQPQHHLSDHFPVLSTMTFDLWRENA